MKSAFKCEICKRDMKRSDKFQIEIMVQEDESTWTGECCADEVCRHCAMKVVKKINTMRRTAKRAEKRQATACCEKIENTVQHYDSFNKGCPRPHGRANHLILCGFKLCMQDISSEHGSPIEQVKKYAKSLEQINGFASDYVLLDRKNTDRWTIYDVYTKPHHLM